MDLQTETYPPDMTAVLTIANKVEQLKRVSIWLEQTARQFELSERTTFKLDLALNEALHNIICYAFADGLSHDIAVKLENGTDSIVLEIVDDGVAFNPFELNTFQQTSSLDSVAIDGRGIHLISSLTDAQEYFRINNTNIMRVNIAKACNVDSLSAEDKA